ncbi:agmatinase [Bradyrhizobium canariense]|uniref:agmatinase n=1 Tax=Bradyrhizobium canariense TaxID=255045 RepID=UPI000A18DC74|nr:agmatinase [Bradyrhizobium canariense]OSI26674.1 agmatinase [Bradyrhizobium canariense]OSI29216.1 agmatinase [Bradyrhizobium canariense]OSI44185.1 agmatinase [Bradyrhizobium canariense]OSI51936.1 agmatinase [Bradyrhizobium canariense]OSI54392.1 agmatinase [Bradyrhizobium canariense]
MKGNPALGADLAAFSGITTFMRQPASRKLDNVDVAIVGVPFDGGTTSFRGGSRFGPRKIREMSVIQWGYNQAMRVAPLDQLRVVDYGDVDVELTNIQKNIKSIAAEVSCILKAGPKIIALGGDHSISYPLLRAHARKYGPLAVVHFDAHSDCSRESVDHGTPFRQAIDDGLIDVEAYVQVGIRGPRAIPNAIELAEEMGAKVLTIDRCFEIGIPKVVRTIRAAMGSRRVYVSLDIDAVDPAYAPATGTPEVGGFTAYQMLQMVRGLRGLNLVGFDLVEVCPPYDNPGEITSVLAANLAFEFLSLLAIGVEAGT